MIRRVLMSVILTIAPCVLYAQVSLDDYSESVLAYSLELQDAEFAKQGAREREIVARKGYLPILSLARELNIEARKPDDGRRWNWLTQLDVSQPIFRGGEVRATAKRAELAFDISEYEAEATEFLVRYTAEVAYWSLSRAEGYYEAIAQYVAIVESLRDVVAERYDAGYISKSDLLQVASRLSDARYQLSEAEQKRDIALHNFNLLRGVEPTSKVVLAESIFNSVALPMRESVDSVILRHPDYNSSELSAMRAFWGIRAERARYLPKIEVGAYALLQPNMPYVRGGGSRLDGGFMLSFSSPIYHFGERRHAVAAARSDYLREVNAIAAVVDRITLEESDTWTNLCATRDRVATAQRNLSIAEENLSISTYSYREGLASILDVLQAQLSWLQIYTNTLSAQYDYAVAVSAYDYVTCR
ncbi:MAG: TolC family protein [Alistipes sp.]|nr:TolC family protein [Alistipes sp.]